MEENIISNVKYPPGIRFHPSDEELLTFYLQRKVNCLELPAHIIADVYLYNYNPWDLRKKALTGDKEWYFFTPRDRKYPNGRRPNRTAISGYWKATGKDIPVLDSTGSRQIGVKKALVFYEGKPRNGVKMDWTMTEYRLLNTSHPSRSKGSMRLDDWVLCRVKHKGNMSKKTRQDNQSSNEILEDQRKIEELPSVHTERSRDILEDYIVSSEFRLIASLLNGHDPANESIPRKTFPKNDSQDSKNASDGHKSSKINTPPMFPQFESFLNAPPSLSEESNYMNFQPLPMSKQKQEVFQSRLMIAGQVTTSNCHDTDNNFNFHYSTNAYVNFQELNMHDKAVNFQQ